MKVRDYPEKHEPLKPEYQFEWFLRGLHKSDQNSTEGHLADIAFVPQSNHKIRMVGLLGQLWMW
jgi:hypothetical protein